MCTILIRNTIKEYENPKRDYGEVSMSRNNNRLWVKYQGPVFQLCADMFNMNADNLTSRMLSIFNDIDDDNTVDSRGNLRHTD